MKIFVNLDKDDVRCYWLGKNFVIDNGQFAITLTPEAVAELLNDMQQPKPESKTDERIP